MLFTLLGIFSCLFFPLIAYLKSNVSISGDNRELMSVFFKGLVYGKDYNLRVAPVLQLTQNRNLLFRTEHEQFEMQLPLKSLRM